MMRSGKLQEDLNRIENIKLTYLNLMKWYIADIGFKSIVLYRLSNFLYTTKRYKLSLIVRNYNIKTTGADISPKAKIEGGLFIPHPNGIVIGPNCSIGKNVTILQQVTLGISKPGTKSNPIIEEDVYLGAGSKVLGSVKIGKGSIVAANSVINKSFSEKLIIGGIPAKILKYDN